MWMEEEGERVNQMRTDKAALVAEAKGTKRASSMTMPCNRRSSSKSSGFFQSN